jgi:pimeloyl-ACP methyl ester carboxylesterase
MSPDFDPTVGTSERVDLDGWDAHLVRWGKAGGGTPVLVLHGFTSHAWSWTHLGQALAAAGHVAVALDQRGHGGSAPTTEYGSRVMLADVVRLLDRLAWAPADIVGQSMGGLNAILLAGLHPERVRKLVVVDIAPEPSAVGLARIRANVGSRPDVFASFEDALEEGRRLWPLADPVLLRFRIEHNLVVAPDGGMTWRTARALRDNSATRTDYSLEERWAAWRAVQAPTLLVHGTESDVLTPDLIERMVADRPSTAVVDIAGAGHSVPLDKPLDLAAAIVAFLAE